MILSNAPIVYEDLLGLFSIIPNKYMNITGM